MIKAIALDDEPPALEVIAHFCSENPKIHLLKRFEQMSDAALFLSQNKVDIVFLDIQMPGKNGIQFYKQIEYPPLVIFTTAFSNFAVEGFNVNAVDYLLKPFTKQRFDAAIDKAILIRNMHLKLGRETIIIRSENKNIKLQLDEIIFIEALDNYVKIILKNNKFIVARTTMKNISLELPSERFVRIHKSFIVSLYKVTAIDGKQLYLNETILPIGEVYKKELTQLFA